MFDDGFRVFVGRVFSTLVSDLASFGCVVSMDGDEILCHSTKFVKGVMTAAMLKEVSALSADCSYVFASDEMIESALESIREKFVVETGKKGSITDVGPLVKKHFRVIFDELSKCYPSTVIHIGSKIGKLDYEMYARRQFLEGRPIDPRRIRKLRRDEGIREMSNSSVVEENLENK